jgi:hypothetical protein
MAFERFVNGTPNASIGVHQATRKGRELRWDQGSGRGSPTILGAFCARVAWPMREIAARSGGIVSECHTYEAARTLGVPQPLS